MCDRKVEFFVPSGIDYRRALVRCGNTDPFGGQAICDRCAADPHEVEARRVQQDNADADNAWLRSAGWSEM